MKASEKQKNNKIIEVVALAMQDLTDQRYLLARRGSGGSGAGFWEFPGGKIEKDESQKQALLREIREELAFDVDSVQLEFLGQNLHRYPQKEIMIYLWRLRVGGKPSFTLVDHDLTQWFLPHELQEIRLSEGDKPFISLL